MKGTATSPFEIWATREGYDTAPAVSPVPTRTYADRDTQAAFDAWTEGTRHVARRIVAASQTDEEPIVDWLEELAKL